MKRLFYLLLFVLMMVTFSCNSGDFSEYKIISSGCEKGACPSFKNPYDAMRDMEKELNSMILLGYKPVGGISVVQSNIDSVVGVVIYQAVAK